MKMLFLALGLVGCGATYSPWQSDPPAYDLTAKHLSWLQQSDTGIYQPFTVAILGDPQAVVGHFDRAAEVINSRSDVDFTVVVGDITDRGMREEFQWVNQVISRFDRPVLTVVGNHDGLNNGKKLYKEMFGNFNYSFIYKDVKFVMWNNNPYEWDVDLQWLKQQVDSYHRVVVISHQPPNDGSLAGWQEDQWKTIRRSPNLIASIHGHIHRYNFQVEQNLPIYVVDRVSGAHYGTASFGEKLIFNNCFSICSTIEVSR